MGMTIDDNLKKHLLDELSKEPQMVLSTAYIYAKNYVQYGEDITKAWTTAVQQASIIEKVKQQTWTKAYDSFKADYENRLKADMAAMLEELKSYIECMAIIELDSTFAEGEKFCADVIQQKINALKGAADDQD